MYSPPIVETRAKIVVSSNFSGTCAAEEMIEHGDFRITASELTEMNQEHDIKRLEELGGVSFAAALVQESTIALISFCGSKGIYLSAWAPLLGQI